MAPKCLDTDEIKAKLEEIYDAVQSKTEGAEEIAERSCWRTAGLHTKITIDMVDRIELGCEVFDEDDLYE